MSTIISQEVLSTGGSSNLVATSVKLLFNSDTVTLPRMTGTSGKVFQLRLPGDKNVGVTQTSETAVTLTGSLGQQVLLISQHDGPIVNLVDPTEEVG